MAVLEDGPYNRTMGSTEHNWCRAMDTGTGITVLGMLFSRSLDLTQLQHALDTVLLRHPRLRSQIVWVDDKPAFQVMSQKPWVQVELVEDPGESQDMLQEYVEAEMNANPWKNQHEEPLPVMAARLVKLRNGDKSLFLLRVHTVACDRAAMAIVMSELLHRIKDGDLEDDESFCDSTEQLLALEDVIPKGQANKPFWAHGVDILGYSLGSLRHALLPFDNPEIVPQRTELIRAKLDVDKTQQLLKRCTDEKTSLFGALTAAGLKAATIYKQLGTRSEHFAIIGLTDCRKHIDLLSTSTVGFYHSAVLNTHHVNEVTEFWDLARRCCDSLSNAIKNRKHFTDMGNINYLMYQALQHPNLTPGSSLRTSFMVMFQEALCDDSDELRESLGLEDYAGCASVHGIGPSLAGFDSIRNGALYCNFVYAAPLYSRDQMQLMVDNIMKLLVDSSSDIELEKIV